MDISVVGLIVVGLLSPVIWLDMAPIEEWRSIDMDCFRLSLFDNMEGDSK